MYFRKGDVVEVSTEDDGFQGALYTAKILKVLPANKFLVEYETLLSEAGRNRPLQEKVDACHLRPCPPQILRQTGFDVHEEVDAFHNDGWWVGVVVRALSGGRYRVYFRDSEEKILFGKSQLRVHQDWINGRWVTASEAIIKKPSLDLVLSPVSSMMVTGRASVEHELPTPNTLSKSTPNLRNVKRKLLDDSLLSPHVTGANIDVQNAKKVPITISAQPPITVSTQPRITEVLQSEKDILQESHFPRRQDGKSSTHCVLDDEDMHQTLAATASNSQPNKRKGRPPSRPEITPGVTDNGPAVSPNPVRKAEGPANGNDRVPRIMSYEDELELRAVLSLPKVKAKIMANEASRNPVNPTKEPNDNSSFVRLIKVPYLKSSTSRVGESDVGDLTGYGSQKDVNKIAYHFLLQALYLQGDHKWSHELWLSELRSVLGINNSDHSKELKRVTSGEYMSPCS